jgi:8-oxo-dGTP pyrophosphatase MutT (NUDIX family)
MADTETSAGGIVYRDGPEILMIADDKGRWSFPKGNVNQSEAPEEAALREVLEETGIRGEIVAEVGESRYFYRARGRLIRRTVRFYLIKALSEAIVPQASEISDARWAPVAEALAISSFPANTQLLAKAIGMIKNGQP